MKEKKVKADIPTPEGEEKKQGAAAGCASLIYGLVALAVVVYAIYVLCSL